MLSKSIDLHADPISLRQILSSLSSTWESIPHKQYENSMCDTMPPSAIWVVIGPQLECLYTEFLLHKLLISQNEGSRDKMIRTSHEILQLALSLLKKNDVIATPNLEGMVSCKNCFHTLQPSTDVDHRWCFTPCHARASLF
jgi:hypothetical protein